MILFSTRLGDLRESALQYIREKIDLAGGVIQLNEQTMLLGDENTYYILDAMGKRWTKSPIENMTTEGICVTADAIHTLPAKDLSK